MASGLAPINSPKLPIIVGLVAMAAFTFVAAETPSNVVAVMAISGAVFFAGGASGMSWALSCRLCRFLLTGYPTVRRSEDVGLRALVKGKLGLAPLSPRGPSIILGVELPFDPSWSARLAVSCRTHSADRRERVHRS
jgi:hypothetical protein